MELLLWSIVCALAIYGLLDILFCIFLPLEVLLIAYERAKERIKKKLLGV